MATPTQDLPITNEMRDLQARGKDPYAKTPGHDDVPGDADTRRRLGRGGKRETFAQHERKGEALSVLDSPEALMAHAQAHGDSVTGQRLRFMRQLCGFEESREETVLRELMEARRRELRGREMEEGDERSR
ncbi:hypothetical protein G7046_g4276 [Stylonectria norvegica]|nr:hypothetical protein G7046_g4276 [Stylonectria norvegica]